MSIIVAHYCLSLRKAGTLFLTSVSASNTTCPWFPMIGPSKSSGFLFSKSLMSFTLPNLESIGVKTQKFRIRISEEMPNLLYEKFEKGSYRSKASPTSDTLVPRGTKSMKILNTRASFRLFTRYSFLPNSLSLDLDLAKVRKNNDLWRKCSSWYIGLCRRLYRAWVLLIYDIPMLVLLSTVRIYLLFINLA